MRKLKKLKLEIEELREARFHLLDENVRLKTTIAGDAEYRESLKKEIVLAQNKYIEQVQKNVALADTIVQLREKLDTAERCGYIDEK
jgi:hypothetical protein